MVLLIDCDRPIAAVRALLGWYGTLFRLGLCGTCTGHITQNSPHVPHYHYLGFWMHGHGRWTLLRIWLFGSEKCKRVFGFVTFCCFMFWHAIEIQHGRFYQHFWTFGTCAEHDEWNIVRNTMNGIWNMFATSETMFHAKPASRTEHGHCKWWETEVEVETTTS